MLLNVNVPDIPYAELRGIEITRLGRRHKAEGMVKAENPRGETVYWIGAAGAAQDAAPALIFTLPQAERFRLRLYRST
jgi:5'-nucleotidase